MWMKQQVANTRKVSVIPLSSFKQLGAEHSILVLQHFQLQANWYFEVQCVYRGKLS